MKKIHLVFVILVFLSLFACSSNRKITGNTVGMNMDRKYWGQYYNNGARDDIKTRIDTLSAYGVRWITLYRVLYLDGVGGSSFYNEFPKENPGWKNYSDKEQAELIAHAHKRGLKVQFAVEILPIVTGGTWHPTHHETWRGNVYPANPDDFFMNLEKEFLETAKFCKKNKVDMLNLGQELVGLSTTEFDGYWENILKKTRKKYKGSISYYFNGGSWSRNKQAFRGCEYNFVSPKFCSLFDFLGITMYPSLSDEAIPSIDSLEIAVEPIISFLQNIKEKTGKDVVIGETSCPSTEFPLTKSYIDWAWNVNSLYEKKESEKAQSNYLQALISACNDKNFKTIIFWHNSYYNSDNPDNGIMLEAGPSPINENFSAKKMLKVIKALE